MNTPNKNDLKIFGVFMLHTTMDKIHPREIETAGPIFVTTYWIKIISFGKYGIYFKLSRISTVQENKMKCKFDPIDVKGPIGMFHCPECGEMVLAGCEHPDYDDFDGDVEEE